MPSPVRTTGSGKSELLRTLVLGLAVTHTSETLNFVLAD
ncbi:FtsK/SpoIIIE domain-containing protein, partial [Streptomyces sp. NPDC031705]